MAGRTGSGGKNPKKVFIGYVDEEDRTRAKYCRDRLQVAGLDPVICDYVFSPGSTTKDKVLKNLKEAEFFMAIHSKRSMKSVWLHQEMGFFFGKNKGKADKLLIISSEVDHVNNPKRMALLTQHDCAIAVGLRRQKEETDTSLSDENMKTLESALDKILCYLIDRGIVAVKKPKVTPTAQTMRLRPTFPCCNEQRWIDQPFLRLHEGYVISFPSGTLCPSCRKSYLLDGLTWEPIHESYSHDIESDQIISREYRLMEEKMVRLRGRYGESQKHRRSTFGKSYSPRKNSRVM